MSDNHVQQESSTITPPPKSISESDSWEGRVSIPVGIDDLIEAGILEEIPPSYRPDQFSLALTTSVLRGVTDLGATVLGVNSRGQWDFLGGFLDMFAVGEKLNGNRSTDFPVLMDALRNRFAEGSLADASLGRVGFKASGQLYAIGLSRPQYGLLLLGASTPVEFSPHAIKMLAYVTETWLGRGDYLRAQTASIPQVTGENSTILFTERQLQVLDLLAEGKTNTEIGRKLSISASLAKQEVAFLAHALQAKNRLDVVVQAQRQGILPVGV